MENKIMEEIKEYMNKYGIKYTDIAKKAGLSKQLVWYYFNSDPVKKKGPDIKLGNLEKICHALGFKLQITLIPEE